MTEMMTETLTGLQVPEFFVSVTGSGSLRDRKYIQDVLEVDPRMDRKWVPEGHKSGLTGSLSLMDTGEEVGPSWTGCGCQDGQEADP